MEPPRLAITTYSMQALATGGYLSPLPKFFLHHNAERWSLCALLVTLGKPLPVVSVTLKERTLSPVAELLIRPRARAVTNEMRSDRAEEILGYIKAGRSLLHADCTAGAGPIVDDNRRARGTRNPVENHTGDNVGYASGCNVGGGPTGIVSNASLWIILRIAAVGTLFHIAELAYTSAVPRKLPKRKAPTAVAATDLARPGAPQPGNVYSIAVLNRAINVLSVFDHARPALGLTEIVAAVGLPKTTVFRLLNSLAARGFCEFDPSTSKYSLGFELVRLAEIRRRQNNVHDIAIPVMREIRNSVNETVILSVRSGDSRVHIDFVEGLHPMRRMADLGVGAPLYAGAASKVLLAGMTDDEIEAYLSRVTLKSFQKTTITDRNVCGVRFRHSQTRLCRE